MPADILLQLWQDGLLTYSFDEWRKQNPEVWLKKLTEMHNLGGGDELSGLPLDWAETIVQSTIETTVPALNDFREKYPNHPVLKLGV